MGTVEKLTWLAEHQLLGKYLKSRLWNLWKHGDTQPMAITSGLTGVAWAAVLMLSPDMFISLKGVYGNFTRVADQSIWAGFAAIIGLGQLFWVLMPSILPGYAWIDRAISGASFLFWGTIFFEFLFSSPLTTATAVYGVLAFGTAWAFLRSGEE